jgi:hypothetical protein
MAPAALAALMVLAQDRPAIAPLAPDPEEEDQEPQEDGPAQIEDSMTREVESLLEASSSRGTPVCVRDATLTDESRSEMTWQTWCREDAALPAQDTRSC